MAFTHTLGVSYRTDAGTVINLSQAVTGSNAGVDIDAQILPGVTATYDVAITPASVVSLMICSDQSGTLMTNDPNTPQDTFTLKANIPIIWTVNAWWHVPFAGNVTRLYLTNTGANAANMKVRVLSN